MLANPLFWQIGIPAALIVLGYVVGSARERAHYRSILEREAALADPPIISIKRVPADMPGLGEAPDTRIVLGSAVISVDYFKRFLASLKMIFGGRVTAYESLVDRARREALLRMRAEAHALGARMIVNVRMETASVSKGRGGAVGTIEVLAYGTAAVPAATVPGAAVGYQP